MVHCARVCAVFLPVRLGKVNYMLSEFLPVCWRNSRFLLLIFLMRNRSLKVVRKVYRIVLLWAHNLRGYVLKQGEYNQINSTNLQYLNDDQMTMRFFSKILRCLFLLCFSFLLCYIFLWISSELFFAVIRLRRYLEPCVVLGDQY